MGVTACQDPHEAPGTSLDPTADGRRRREPPPGRPPAPNPRPSRPFAAVDLPSARRDVVVPMSAYRTLSRPRRMERTGTKLLYALKVSGGSPGPPGGDKCELT